MRIELLEGYGIAPEIVRIWRETVGANLLPVQAKAVMEYGLFSDQNLVVFSPTSSGKTFVGEMAAVRAALAKTKVFYLVPQKALAEEKFMELRRRYAEAGIEVVVSSRDRREFDGAIQRGAFQIAVIVFEKLASLLVSRPALLQTAGLIVVDELQVITDEMRGPALELLLTKVMCARPRPRLVGLSAVLGRAELLAQWLQARLIVDTRRPVELRKGVLCRGVFTYKEHNAGTQGTEQFADSGSEEQHEMILAAAEDLVARGEQVLVFLPDRSATVGYARAFARRVSLPAISGCLEELREHDDTHAREALAEVLENSVAFHNSDLSPHERDLVERHFRSGAIRAVFSTATLAMGLNLPVKNVIIEERKWKHFRRYGRWDWADITKSEYENMSGRAGRLSLTKDFGRSILVTKSKFQVRSWLDYYVERDFEDVVPTLKDAALDDHVVNLIASETVQSRAALIELLLASFTGFAYWSQKMSRDEFVRELERAVSKCLKGGLLREVGEHVVATDLGRACASKGLGVDTTIRLAAWVRESRETTVSELEVLTVLSLTPAAGDVHISLKKMERNRADYLGMLQQRAMQEGIAERSVFRNLRRDSPFLSEYDEHKAWKKTLLLHDWIAEVPTRQLEQGYQVWAGAMGRIAEEYSWVADGLASIAAAEQWPDERRALISRIADRLVHGVRPDAAGLSSVRVRGLGRVGIRRLVKAGLVTEADLQGVGQEDLRKILGNRRAAAAVYGYLHAERKPRPYAEIGEDAPPTVALRAADAPAPEEPVLRIDVAKHRLHYRGIEVATKPPGHIQPAAFRGLAVLALHHGEAVGMATLAEETVPVCGVRKKPVAPEQRDLRYRIVQALKKNLCPKGIPEAEIEALIENLTGVGLRLVVPGVVEVLGAGGPSPAKPDARQVATGTRAA